jgi:hypothetical protein
MSLIAVHRFTVWDQTAGENVITPRFATLEAIRRVQGDFLPETNRVVDSSDLDGDGFFPKPNIWIVEILGAVFRQDGTTRVSVPLGEYTMCKCSTETYTFSDDLLPLSFELSLSEVTTFLQDKMRIIAGIWP